MSPQRRQHPWRRRRHRRQQQPNLLRNTIVAKGATALGKNYVGQRTVSRGNNLSDDGSCNLNQESDQENTEPLLTPIADDDEPNALVFEPQPYSPVMNMAANRTRAQV